MVSWSSGEGENWRRGGEARRSSPSSPLGTMWPCGLCSRPSPEAQTRASTPQPKAQTSYLLSRFPQQMRGGASPSPAPARRRGEETAGGIPPSPCSAAPACRTYAATPARHQRACGEGRAKHHQIQRHLVWLASRKGWLFCCCAWPVLACWNGCVWCRLVDGVVTVPVCAGTHVSLKKQCIW